MNHLKVPEELAEAITNKTDTPAIVHAVSKEQTNLWELESWFSDRILGIEAVTSSNSKKPRTYNIFDKNPDFKNCYGWSLTVTKKQLKSLKHTDIGFLMVNLTAVSDPPFLGYCSFMFLFCFCYITHFLSYINKGINDGATLESKGNRDNNGIARGRHGSSSMWKQQHGQVKMRKHEV